MLRQMVESMIASGKRNVCVDISQLDYLYSDTINALIVINRRMLDVMGRLSLLAPQPSVLEILKKSGVHNILKIFINEMELMRTSDELMGMGSVAGVASAQTSAPSKPQSEFDDLRNEIGSAFEVPQRPPISQHQAAAPDMFADQPSMPQRQAYVPPSPPQFSPPPALGPATRYAPPPPPLRPFETGAPRPAARPYTPPPPPKPAPLSTGMETRRMPPVQESSAPGRQQPGVTPEEDLDKFEATLEKKAPTFEKTKRDRFDDDFEDTPKKKSFVPILVGLVVLVVLAGGGFFGYMTFSQKKGEKTPPAAQTVAQPPKQAAAAPQLPLETATPAATPAPEPAAQPVVKEETKKPEPPAVVKEEPAPKKPVRVATPKPRPKPAVEAKPALAKPVVAEPKPKRPESVVEAPPVEKTPQSNIEVIEDEPPPPRPAVVEKPQPRVTAPPPEELALEPASAVGDAASVFIASIPPVADIYMDGKLIGKTNISELKVAAGTHTLRFVKGDKEVTKQQTFQAGKNPSMMVRIQ